MKSVAAEAIPLGASSNGNGNGNGHHPATNGNGAAAESAVLLPHLTPQGLRKLLERENNPCGPGLLATRIRAVVAAQSQEEPEAKLLAGALEDLAAAAVGYSYRVRAAAGIWPKPLKPKAKPTEALPDGFA